MPEGGIAPPPAPSDLASPCPADPSGSTACPRFYLVGFDKRPNARVLGRRDERKARVPGQLSFRAAGFKSARLVERSEKSLASRRLAHVQADRFTEIFSPELPRFRWRGRLLSLYICA